MHNRNSITGFVVLMVTSMACGCGRVSKYPDEAEAIAVVQKLDGKVEIDGHDEQRRVVKVYLHNTAVKDADLAVLKKLPKLRNLFLGKTQIGDVGLEHLQGLSDLQTIAINSTRITNAGLKSLAQLKTLKTINLQETQVTAEAVAELRLLLPGTTIAR